MGTPMCTWIFNHMPKSTRGVSSVTAFTGVSQAPLMYGMTYWWNHCMIQFMAKAISIYQSSSWAFIWVHAHRKLLHLRPWRKTTLIFLKEIQVIASLSTFGLHSHWKLWIHFKHKLNSNDVHRFSITSKDRGNCNFENSGHKLEDGGTKSLP